MSLPYLLASLPYLTLEGTNEPMSAEAFVAACKEQLSEGDAKVVEELVMGNPDQPTSRKADKPGVRLAGKSTGRQFGNPAGRLAGLSTGRNSFVKAWLKKEALIRNAVARCRVAYRGKGERLATVAAREDARPPCFEDFEIAKAVDAAFELKNPAARDAALERLKWEIVEKLVGFDPMSRDAVFGYAVKLKICLRRAAMTREAGLEVSQKILEAPLPVATEEMNDV